MYAPFWRHKRRGSSVLAALVVIAILGVAAAVLQYASHSSTIALAPESQTASLGPATTNSTGNTEGSAQTPASTQAPSSADNSSGNSTGQGTQNGTTNNATEAACQKEISAAVSRGSPDTTQTQVDQNSSTLDNPCVSAVLKKGQLTAQGPKDPNNYECVGDSAKVGINGPGVITDTYSPDQNVQAGYCNTVACNSTGGCFAATRLEGINQSTLNSGLSADGATPAGIFPGSEYTTFQTNASGQVSNFSAANGSQYLSDALSGTDMQTPETTSGSNSTTQVPSDILAEMGSTPSPNLVTGLQNPPGSTGLTQNPGLTNTSGSLGPDQTGNVNTGTGNTSAPPAQGPCPNGQPVSANGSCSGGSTYPGTPSTPAGTGTGGDYGGGDSPGYTGNPGTPGGGGSTLGTQGSSNSGGLNCGIGFGTGLLGGSGNSSGLGYNCIVGNGSGSSNSGLNDMMQMAMMAKLIQGMVNSGNTSVPPGNQTAYSAGTCSTQYLCSGNEVYYQQNTCVQSPYQTCQYGCDAGGASCASQPPYGVGTDGNACAAPVAQPSAASCTSGTWMPVAAANQCPNASWQCVSSQQSTPGTSPVGNGTFTVTVGDNGNPLTAFIHFSSGVACDDAFQITWGDGDQPNVMTYAPPTGGATCAATTQTNSIPHTYSTAGTYTVTLEQGPSLTQGSSQQVTVGQASSTTGSTLSATPTSGAAPLSVSFSGTIANFSGGAYTIAFGDGTSAQPGVSSCTSGASCPIATSHSYATAGTYTANLQNPSGTTIASVNVTVTGTSGAPLASLSCSPQITDVGKDVTLAYQCQNATTATGSGFLTGGVLSGTTTAAISTPQSGTTAATYTLTCTNAAGQTAGAQCSTQINQPSIVLVANPNTVASGDSTSIGWVTTGMQSCAVTDSPDMGGFNAANANNTTTSGAAVLSDVTGSATVTLTCQTLGGQTKTATTLVQIGSGSTGTSGNQPVTVSSSADGASTAHGSTVTINWTSTNPPSGSAMSLWLVNEQTQTADDLIAGDEPTSGSYSWNVPASGSSCTTGSANVCASDLVAGHSYAVEAVLYSPTNAYIGSGVAPANPVQPTYGASAVGGTFTISQ